MFKKLIFIAIIFAFTEQDSDAFLLFQKKKKDANNNEMNFYDEDKDTERDLSERKYKNYSKIGFEKYSQKNIWQKKYVGVDINWYMKRIGDDVKGQIFYSNFLRRLQNLDIYAGMRIFKYFGSEIGYTHIGNFTAKNGEKRSLDGMYITAVFYSHVIDLKYSSIESYISVGGAMLAGVMNKGRPEFGAKFGGGVIVHLYSTVALNIGLDYYFPFHSYTNKGFFAVKTGINLYLNI